ncbi:transposase domain-containing protein [Sorangium sp. So ce136]
MFARSNKEAERLVIGYTLFGACRMHGVNPLAWATDVISKLQTGWSRDRLDELLPDAWTSLSRAAPADDADATCTTRASPRVAGGDCLAERHSSTARARPVPWADVAPRLASSTAARAARGHAHGDGWAVTLDRLPGRVNRVARAGLPTSMYLQCSTHQHRISII